ncbi:aminoacyl-tRNA deacylase [Piscinibacter koreensis]|uniref:YbaK/EbsC family protein n=1 Tax=Piscinibacter koreensis TaxID=2742824 RepID=A0A7Y6TWG9_9BURK|nr:YbaK/EbsC family protein [Schlegelella koreensis]NUZ06002.1 YbaK/EbsC family protein [Schlegelella koreensis]
MSLDTLPPRLQACIAAHGVAVEVVASAEAAASAETAARILGVEVGDIVKTLVLTDGVRSFAAVIPGHRRLDRRKLAAVVGAVRTPRFASADEVLALSGYPAGGVAPLAFATALTMVVDAAVAAPPGRMVVAGGGRPELLIRLGADDIVRLNAAVVAPVSADAA